MSGGKQAKGEAPEKENNRKQGRSKSGTMLKILTSMRTVKRMGQGRKAGNQASYNDSDTMLLPKHASHATS